MRGSARAARAPSRAIRSRCVAAVAAGLVLLFGASCSRSSWTTQLRSPSPYTSARPFAQLETIRQTWDLRIQQTVQKARADGLADHRIFGGFYGSGFLRQNQVGNDLDTLLGLHLGRVTVDPANTAPAAAEIVRRIDGCLACFQKATSEPADPAFLFEKWDCPFVDGRLTRHDEICARLAALLDDLAADRPHLCFLPGSTGGTASSTGGQVASTLPRGQGYIDEMLMATLLTNRLRFADSMPCGIRAITVKFYFAADLDIRPAGVPSGPAAPAAGGSPGRVVRDVLLAPTHTPRGLILQMDREVWHTAADGDASARWFTQLVRSDPDAAARNRVLTAALLLLECDRQLAGGDRIKAVKRLHESMDAIQPAIDPPVHTELEAFIQQALGSRNPDALLCQEIAELAARLADVLNRSLPLRVFVRTGDPNAVADQLVLDAETLVGRHREISFEGLAVQAWQVHSAIEAVQPNQPPGSKPVTAAATQADRLSELAADAIRQFCPATEAITAQAEQVKAVLTAAGVRLLPVYGLVDQTYGVRAEDLAATGQSLAEVSALPRLPQVGSPPVPISVVLTADQVPTGANGKHLPPSTVLVLLAARTPAERAAQAKLLDALRTDCQLYGQKRSAS